MNSFNLINFRVVNNFNNFNTKFIAISNITYNNTVIIDSNNEPVKFISEIEYTNHLNVNKLSNHQLRANGKDIILPINEYIAPVWEQQKSLFNKNIVTIIRSLYNNKLIVWNKFDILLKRSYLQKIAKLALDNMPNDYLPDYIARNTVKKIAKLQAIPLDVLVDVIQDNFKLKPFQNELLTNFDPNNTGIE